MAEGFGGSNRENLTPLEEQYIREDEEGGDVDELLIMEKDLAAQRLWQAFQESATAVAHLFRDCQQRAGLSSWVPFHESASAVTQLYRGSADVCRQCIDCGIKYGYKKRTKDVLTWAKKKKRFIKREELIAFLLDKPEQSEHSQSRMEEVSEHANSPMSSCCYSASIPSPRRRIICREDHSMSDLEPFSSSKDLPRKRQNSIDISGGFCTEFGPLTKRIKFD